MSRQPQVWYESQTREHASTGVVSSFMNQVYAWMSVGLGVTALVAWLTASNLNLLRTVLNPGTLLVLVLAELALVWVISAAINKIDATVATGLFIVYAALNGLTLSVIFLVYTAGSVAGAFVATAGMFGAMSLIGFTTRIDLTRMGGFLLMALIGLILASIVNIFVASSALYWVITYAGILVFLGLTAYDTQKLIQIAHATDGDPRMAARLAVVGSLSLYLDFINLFLFILRILGSRRS